MSLVKSKKNPHFLRTRDLSVLTPEIKATQSTYHTQSVSKLSSEDAKFQSQLSLRELVETRPIYDTTPLFHSVSPQMRMDFSRMVEKPFHLSTFSWNTQPAQADAYSLSFPSAVIALNRLASAPFDLSSLFHLKACFVIQVAGTPMHSGCLVAYVTPNKISAVVGAGGIHQAQSAPHCYLHANSSNAACIEIPWYSPLKLRFTSSLNDGQDETGFNPFNGDATNADYANLNIRVVSPLGVPTSGASTLVVTIAVMFKEINCFVPKASYVTQSVATALPSVPPPTSASLVTHGLDSFAQAAKTFTSDIVDYGRGWIRSMTGLHNPNIRNPGSREIMAMRNNPNYVDKETYLYKLDPYAQFSTPMHEYHSDCTHDEGDIRTMCKKPMMVSVVNVRTSMVTGSLLFSAPISPLMFRGTTTNGNSTIISAPIDKLSRLARFWSGDLELILHNMGSAFHMYKLIVVKEYSTSFQTFSSPPPLANFLNNPTDIVEFSSGGQTHHVSLPMASMFDEIPLSPDFSTNGLIHGRVSIYLLQPMVTNGSVTTACDFAVHLRAMPNFTLYGYSGDELSLPASVGGTAMTTAADIQLRKDIHKASTAPVVADATTTISVLKANTQSMAQSNCDSAAPTVLSEDCSLVAVDPAMGPAPSIFNFRPLVNVRDLCRRMLPLPPITATPSNTNAGVYSIPVSSFLSTQGTYQQTILKMMMSMYYGYRGGFKVKLLIRGCSDAIVSYLPPVPMATDLGTAFTNGNRIRIRSAIPLNATLPAAKSAQINRLSSFRAGNSSYFGPVLESADHRDVHPATDSVGTSTTEQPSDPLASVSEFEFEIPWMNACRFVANNYNYGTFAADYYIGCLGHISIGLNSLYNQNFNAGTSTISPVYITPYVGIDDCGRFLYQVLAAPLVIPTIGAGAYPAQVQDTNFSANISILNTTNDIPATATASSPNMYVGSGA